MLHTGPLRIHSTYTTINKELSLGWSAHGCRHYNYTLYRVVREENVCFKEAARKEFKLKNS